MDDSVMVFPDTLSNTNQHVIPPSALSALGVPMTSYMRQKTRRIRVCGRSGVPQYGTPIATLSCCLCDHHWRSLTILLCHLSHRMLKSSVSAEGMLAEGTLVERRIQAPKVYVHGEKTPCKGTLAVRQFF